MDELTPRQIVAELDKYIIGQGAAKRAVAIALRNRYRRRQLDADMRDDIIPKNILMIGPTGVGKTEIARRLASLAHAPFVKVEATKFTEVGYVGRDVDSMVRDLVQSAVRMVEREKMDEVTDKAKERAIDRILDILQPKPKVHERVANQVSNQVESLADALNNMFRGAPAGTIPPPQASPAPSEPADAGDEAARKRSEQAERIRARLREQIVDGSRDQDPISIDVEDNAAPPLLQILGAQPGMPDDLGGDMQGMLGGLLPKRRKRRNVTIAEAKEILAHEEARLMIDQDQVTREAIERAEQTGIIFVDEMDKIAGKGDGAGRGPDVSREGVQRDILPIIEGSTVQTKYGSVRTDYVLFIAAGAFHLSKPSDLIPELQGRLPIRVELDNLTVEDFRRILTEPRNALIRQYEALLASEGVTLTFSEDGIEEIARIAALANEQMENIGARRLHTIMERLLDEVSFEAPADAPFSVMVNAPYVRQKLEAIVKDEDLSHYIL
ncbi:MAG: ATP-dependent protease ATPase subunit HslU [Capsulimonadaceae bacterium]|nr:ATP-dependent protease ATPase subunit HslU [Capsulimonadaceae bacterium]